MSGSAENAVLRGLPALAGLQIESLADGGLERAPVGKIEASLAALWRHASQKGVTVTRACLWNLVARVDDEAAYRRVKLVLDEIVAVCPARALLLRGDGAASDDDVVALIGANCKLGYGGKKLLCAEEIVLRANEAGAALVPPLVRALLVPDVPTAMLELGGRLPSPKALSALLPGADRLVVDTGAMDGPAALATLAALDAHASGATLADLGWLRTEPLRFLLASLFDPPVGIEPLRRAERVVLTAGAASQATGALFLGWIADRLGWSREDADREGARTTTLAARPGGGHVELVLASERESAEPRAPIHAIEIEGPAGKFSLRRSSARCVETRSEGFSPCVLSAPEHADSELLVAALGARGRDPQLVKALRRAAELFA